MGHNLYPCGQSLCAFDDAHSGPHMTRLGTPITAAGDLDRKAAGLHHERCPKANDSTRVCACHLVGKNGEHLARFAKWRELQEAAGITGLAQGRLVERDGCLWLDLGNGEYQQLTKGDGIKHNPWECPRCHRINAPHSMQCSCSGQEAG